MLNLDVRQNPETVNLDSTHALATLAGHMRRAWPQLREPLVLRWSDEPVLALDTARALEGLVATASHACAGALDILRDPIIFGVIAPARPISGQPALWYPLVAWRW